MCVIKVYLCGGATCIISAIFNSQPLNIANLMQTFFFSKTAQHNLEKFEILYQYPNRLWIYVVTKCLVKYDQSKFFTSQMVKIANYISATVY